MKQPTERTTISMRPVVANRAKQLAETLGTDVSGVIQQLITAEYERRTGVIQISSSPVSQDIKALEQAAQLEADRLRRESQRKRATPSPNARKRKPKPGASN